MAGSGFMPASPFLDTPPRRYTYPAGTASRSQTPENTANRLDRVKQHAAYERFEEYRMAEKYFITTEAAPRDRYFPRDCSPSWKKPERWPATPCPAA